MESTTDLIDLITVYPKYKSISNIVETCSNKCSYHCKNVFECDFTKCLEYVKQNKNLNTNEKATTAVILDVLQKNQERFTVRQIGGFILENNPNFQLVVLNESHSEILDNTRFGLCNLNKHFNKIK
jgi:hypothetical protein